MLVQMKPLSVPWLTLLLIFLLYLGLGNSKEATAPAKVGDLAPDSFLLSVLKGLELNSVVIISPSLSGMYSLPFLFGHCDMVRGFIPVAPICTEKFSAEQYSSVQ
eukprot:g26296.t1